MEGGYGIPSAYRALDKSAQDAFESAGKLQHYGDAYYDPAPVVNNNYTSYPPPYYSDPYPPYWAPAATFFTGMFVGAAFSYGFDWNNGDIDIDNDIDISRGDVNIGSGNNSIDRTNIDQYYPGECTG